MNKENCERLQIRKMTFRSGCLTIELTTPVCILSYESEGGEFPKSLCPCQDTESCPLSIQKYRVGMNERKRTR